MNFLLYYKSNNYKLLSGGTDLALEVTKKRKDIETLIYLGNNKDLKYIKIMNKKIIIGAATPINDTLEILNKYYPEIAEMYLRYGSLQIRNVATIGGNLANASPIVDSAPALISLDSSIMINGKNKKTIKLNNFFLNYKKTLLKKDEFIQEIIIPIKKEVIFKCYKISKRFDDDISAVFMAITLKLKNTTIENILITLGGMAEIPKRAEKTEKFLKGKKLNLDNIILAQSIIIKEFTPLSDMRASSDYRKKLAIDYSWYYTFFKNNPREGYGFRIAPRYRFNNQFSLVYSFRYNHTNNDQGFVNDIDAKDVKDNPSFAPLLDKIIFGQRKS